MSSDIPSCNELRSKVPSDWEVKPLDEVTDFQEGPGILAKDFQGSGVPLLRLRNIETPRVRLDGCNFLDPDTVRRKWSHFALKEGDLLISTSASLGRVSVVGSSAIGTIPYTGIIRFRTRDDRLHHEYLRAFLSSKNFVEQAEKMATGSVIKHFGPSHLRQMAIALPPVATQVQIAEMFDVLDDRILLLRETNATLEAIAQALFKSWFVDFDPVRAKMEGRVPEGMDEATAALFPDSFVETELREMPRGWRAGCLADIAKTFKKQVTTPDLLEGIKYVGLEHIPRKSLSLTDWGDAAELESNKSAFAKGDILFGKLRPYFHKVVVAPIDGVCSTDILVCQPTQAEHYGVATMHLFSDELISYADRLSNGAKMPRVNWSDLAQFHITVPPVPVSKAYTEAIEPLLRRMRHNTHAAQTLATLRDSLLPRLISGRIRLGDAYAVANLFDISEVQMSN